jgi:hypothetical protein
MPPLLPGFMRVTSGVARRPSHSIGEALIMTVAAAQLLVQTTAIYATIGGVFATVFLWRWVGRLDSAAEHGTWGFRVLVFPGVVALWPFFIVRLIRR